MDRLDDFGRPGKRSTHPEPLATLIVENKGSDLPVDGRPAVPKNSIPSRLHRKIRSAWRYRDYVIGAFNGNMPYDGFHDGEIAGGFSFFWSSMPDEPYPLIDKPSSHPAPDVTTTKV